MFRLYSFLLLLLAVPASAQQWTIKEQNQRSLLEARPVLPKQYLHGSVSWVELQQKMETGSITLLMPDGSDLDFKISTISNFAVALAQSYPEIRTALIENKEQNIKGRIDMSPHGMHAVLRDNFGEIYIDPVKDSQQDYLIYYTKYDQLDPSLKDLYRNHEHGFTQADVEHFINQKPIRSPFARHRAEVDLRVYDLAVSCTGEYSNKHGGTVAGALGAINTALNRINFVLETELAITLRLIEENESLVFLDAETDPFTNGSAAQMAIENNNFLLETLGSSKYDVGHVFGTGCSQVVGLSGGVGTVCGSLKGYGSSCEISTTDRFYIGVVCHELGHQFGAEHTWNNCPTSDDSQFNSATAFEPGSGSTIMSYGGACGDQNVVSTSDNYFHVNSIEAIGNYIMNGSGNGCASIQPSGNQMPSVSIGLVDGFYIPVETPFKLTAQGQDLDGDSITYCWEQFDPGVSTAAQTDINEPMGDAPIFRSLPPTISPTRYFPALDKVVNNQFDNREVLPTYDRKLTFRATVRDNQLGGGGVSWETVTFRASEQAGPFRMIPLDADTLSVGDFVEIKWDVAATNLLPVDCQLVDIILSVDGGKTFTDTLIASTLNDGSESVLIPQETSSAARIMVAAADNIFFTVNDTAFAIVEGQKNGVAIDVQPRNQITCLPSAVSVQISSFALGNFDEEFWLADYQLPQGVSILSDTVFNIGSEATLELDFSQITLSGDYSVKLDFTSSIGDTLSRVIEVTAISNDFSDLMLLQPEPASGISTRPTFSWQGSNQADGYIVEVDKTPAFTAPISMQNEANTALVLESLLDESTLYYWRIVPYNACGTGEPSKTNAFHTVNLACDNFISEDVPKNLTQSAISEISSEILVSTEGEISDVNVTAIKGFHESFGDLKVSLKSPQGSIVDLVRFQCGFSNRTFNLGFDDEAAENLSCQMSFNNVTFKPEMALDALQGEGITGNWALVVSDSMVGSGGRIEGFELELCGSISAVDPVLVQSDTLFALYGQSTALDKSLLQVEDDASLPSSLIYTLVSVPEFGILRRGSDALQTGNMFSQEDINTGLIQYDHLDQDSMPDQFIFTVVDGTGGWLGPHTFPIEISEVVPLREVNLSQYFRLAPNPTQSTLHVFKDDVHTTGVTRILSLQGVMMAERIMTSGEGMTFYVGHLPTGMYVLQIMTTEGIANLRFLKH